MNVLNYFSAFQCICIFSKVCDCIRSYGHAPYSLIGLALLADEGQKGAKGSERGEREAKGSKSPQKAPTTSSK